MTVMETEMTTISYHCDLVGMESVADGVVVVTSYGRR